MDIYWYGQSCFKIKGKTATVVIDPFDSDYTGLKLPKDLEAQLVLSTHNHNDHNNVRAILGNPLIVTGPGEYEKVGVNVIGLASFHDNCQGAERGLNTIYHILMDGINLVHLGDLGHELSDELVNGLGTTDILMIPVGGVPTIDAEKAAKVIAQLEPRMVIPMHYAIEGLKFPLENADKFLKEMGAENITAVAKVVITKDKLPEETAVVVLNKS